MSEDEQALADSITLLRRVDELERRVAELERLELASRVTAVIPVGDVEGD